MKYPTVITAAISMLALLSTGSGLRAQTVPTNGLVGFWSGNGNANDSSSYGNNGTFSGPYAPGPSPGTQAFDVSPTDYFSAPDIPAYDFTTSFSVGVWFYGNDFSGGYTFLGQDNGAEDQNKWFIGLDDSDQDLRLHMNSPSGGPNETLSATVSLSDEWHQFTITDNDDTFSFYLDGSFISSTYNTYPFPDPSAPLTIGYLETDAGGPSGYTGDIADLTLYDRALTSNEVEGLSTLSVPEPSTWAMMAAGAGIMLGFRRRRRS